MPSAKELKKRLDEAFENMQKMRALLIKPSVRKAVRNLSPEDKVQYDGIVLLLDKGYEEAGAWKYMVDKLAEWEDKKMHPRAFRTLMKEYWDHADGDPANLALMDVYMQGQARPKIDQFGTGMNNASDEDEIVAELSNIAQLKDIRGSINDITDDWAKALHTFQQKLHEVEQEAIKQEHAEAHHEGPVKSLLNTLGVEFHSPITIWEGFKKVWEAYGDAIKEHQTHLADNFAHGVSKALVRSGVVPFANEADSELEKKVESHFNGLKNDYKEKLTTDNKKFKELFSDDGELHKHHHDHAKSLAVLEYAASKGWLYDIDDDTQDPDNIVLFGHFEVNHMFPQSWNYERRKNYLRSLKSQNVNGVSEQTNKGKSDMGANESPQQFVDAINAHMNNLNFWGAIGVIDAFVSSQKNATASAASAVTVLENMRNNPDIRKYLSKSVIERFGFRTFHKGPFVLSAFTMDKGAIYEWAQKTKKGDAGDLSEAGQFGGWVQKIEQVIQEKNPAIKTRKELNAVTTEVLLGKVVDLKNGTFISIFEPVFNGFRTDNNVTKAFNEPHQITHDSAHITYFSEPSEVIMMNDMYVHHIFTTDSQGTFKNREAALMLIGQYVQRWDDLGKIRDRAAQEQLETDVRHKVDHAFNLIFDARHDGIQNETPIGCEDNHDTIFNALKKRNMISDNILKKASWNKAKPSSSSNQAPPAAANVPQSNAI